MGADCGAAAGCCQNEAEIVQRKKGASIVSGAPSKTQRKVVRIVEDQVDDVDGTGASSAQSDKDGSRKRKTYLLKAIESEDTNQEDDHFGDVSHLEEHKATLEMSDDASTCSSK